MKFNPTLFVSDNDESSGVYFTVVLITSCSIINYLEAVTSLFRTDTFLLKKLSSIAIGDGNGCSETFCWIGSLRNV